MKTVLLFLSFVALVYTADLAEFTVSVNNTLEPLTPGSIYYTPDTGYFSLGNIENPISIEILFLSGDADAQASICLVPDQKDYPVPGNNLENACPEGGFIVAQNVSASTGQLSKLKFTRKNSSLRGQFLSKMVEDTSDNTDGVYALPTNSNTAGFVVTTTSASNVTFQITLTGLSCTLPDFPVNGTCAPLQQADTTGKGTVITVPAGVWGYSYFNTELFNPTVINQVNVNVNVSGNVYIQRGYLPTTSWNIGEATLINTPGTTTAQEVYYVGFDNTAGTTDLVVLLNVTFAGCAAGLVGPNCAVNTTVSNSTMDGSMVIALDANLNITSGTPISLDLSDSENEFVYFQLVDLPTFNQTNGGFPYYVRVSVGNNDLSDDDDGNVAPTLYAKKDGYPSAESNDYAVSGGVANQVFLLINSADDQWFLAAPTPADFSIWVGVNCGGSCDHGSCMCSAADGTSVDCSSIANSTDYYALYASLPTSTEESAGSCTCEDDDYAESFDCSQKSSPTVLFIVLIIIGGLIILFVAIGVPLYCYISNKRKERYERI